MNEVADVRAATEEVGRSKVNVLYFSSYQKNTSIDIFESVKKFRLFKCIVYTIHL